jgi:HEAT repeat protein
MLWWRLRQLKSTKWERRARAARKLGRSRDSRAVDALIEALRKGDSAAADALGLIGDTRAIQPLIIALLDYPKLSAARTALTTIDLNWAKTEAAKNALPILLAALDEREPSVHAARVLREIADPTALEPLLKAYSTACHKHDEYLSKATKEAIVAIGDLAVNALAATLESSDVYMASVAAAALGEINSEQSLTVLIAALKSESSYTRWEVASVLGHTGKAVAVDPLIDLIKDPDEQVRISAVGALGKLRDERAIEPLLTALRDEDDCVRTEALMALGEIGDGRAVGPLLEILNHIRQDSSGAAEWEEEPSAQYLNDLNQEEHNEMRSWAAFALGDIGDVRAIDSLLIAMFDKREPEVAQAALKALLYMRTEAWDRLSSMPEARFFPPLRSPWRRGGLHEPYCSEECYQKAGAEMFTAQVREVQGRCAFCQSERPVTITSGAFFPWRKKRAFICRLCMLEAAKFIAEAQECCQCGNAY